MCPAHGVEATEPSRIACVQRMVWASRPPERHECHVSSAWCGHRGRAPLPPQYHQLLLHETAVAWVRARQTITTPKKPWTETREAFGERLRAIARHINTQYRVDDLCREFPGRIHQLIDVEGDNLKK